MASPSDRPIQILLTVRPHQAALLEGLDVWLQLGLISETQVKRLCQEQLACPLPEPTSVATTDRPADDFAAAPIEPPRRRTRVATRTATPNPVTQVVQSFMAEVSVLWLLFLGVFLVVVSSAVLAASQWRNVPALGQYGILLTYTLIFWGISAWAGQRANLRQTTQMLRVTTLLLIPVNFWMMDGFKLWNSGIGWLVAAIAALSLTAILVQLLRSQLTRFRRPRWLLADCIALSWLHWGWAFSGFPLLATYFGTIATAFAVVDQASEPPNRNAGNNETVAAAPILSLTTLAIAFSTLLLVGRAVLVAQVPIDRLGLALGICGWVLGWLSRRDGGQAIWERIGLGLLLAGWLAAVPTNPVQAIGVSGLGIWLLFDRLGRRWQLFDLTMLFLVGLQSCWLLWRVLPMMWQQTLMDTGMRLAGPEGMPQTLLGLWFFPYVGLMLMLAEWLRRQQQSTLAKQAETMVLLLGIGLTASSAFNPLVRAVNLGLSFVTLAIVARNRPTAETGLIYLMHGVGLGAIGSGLRVMFPTWTVQHWISALLVGTLIEWSFTVGTHWQRWRQSAWHFGLGLAALSGALLLSEDLVDPSRWAVIWLVIPAALTGLSYRRQFPEPQAAAWLSTVTLLLVPSIAWETATPRLISLGVGTLLMLLNTERLKVLATALLTMGFALVFGAAIVWERYAEQLTLRGWLSIVAAAILVLWLLRGWLRSRSARLPQLYSQATDGWAIGLTLPTLLILTGYLPAVYLFGLAREWEWVLTAGLLTVGLSLRTWQQPQTGSDYGLALAIELLVTTLITLIHPSLDWLAIATLALSFITQLAGDWRFYRARSPEPFRPSWHLIPLLYALTGILFAHHRFATVTGLYTLAAALIAIVIGQRTVQLKPIAYLGLIGVSIAAYELLIYQLSQMQGGFAGDGFVLMATLAAAIAIGQRTLTQVLLPYLRFTEAELRAFAHAHWGLGTAFSFLAWSEALSPTGEWLWTAVVGILALYALIQGRSIPGWIYIGIGQAVIAIGDGFSHVLPEPLLSAWAATIACGFAVGMYVLPWQDWGWSALPWQQSATLLQIAIVALTPAEITIQSLFMVAAFYAWLAKAKAQIRLSYLSVLLANWAVLRLFDEYSVTEPIWYMLLWGSSLLYVAQVDPGLQAQSERQKRHLLRCLATGLICLTALYQAEVGITGMAPLLVGFLTIGFSLAFVLLGIALRIRAFLYIGTIAFILRVLRQVQTFIQDDSLVLWAVGIAIGSLFIWVALTFEARRSQFIAFVQYWLTELEAWE